MFTLVETPDIILEIADLTSYNKYTHDIEVSKYIFDDFEQDKIIYIHFVEDNDNCIREYRMKSEDEYDIKMSYLCEYCDD